MKQQWEHHFDMGQSTCTSKIAASDKDFLQFLELVLASFLVSLEKARHA